MATNQAGKPANPAPLGLMGFGLTTVLLSSINAGLIPPEGINAVVPLAFAFGGLAQIIAGILEYASGNTFGMVAFTAYGTFWWWFAFMLWTIGAGWLKGPAPVAVAVCLALWGLFTLGLWISTFKKPLAIWLVFLTLWATFFLLAAGDAGVAQYEAFWRPPRNCVRSVGDVQLVCRGDQRHLWPRGHPDGRLDCEVADRDVSGQMERGGWIIYPAAPFAAR